VLAGFQLLGEIILGAIPGIGEDAKEKFGNVMTTIRANITGEDGIKGVFDQAIGSWANLAKTKVTAEFNELEAGITGADLGGVIAAETTKVDTAKKEFKDALADIPKKVLEAAANIEASLEDFKIHLPTPIGNGEEVGKGALDMPTFPGGTGVFGEGGSASEFFKEHRTGLEETTSATEEETGKQQSFWETFKVTVQGVQDTISFGFKDKLIAGFKGLGNVLGVPEKDWDTFGTNINETYKTVKTKLGLTSDGIATDFAEFTTQPMIKVFEEATSVMLNTIWSNFRTELQKKFGVATVFLTIYERTIKSSSGGGGGGGGHQVGLDYVPETGNYLLHRGEKVLRANESSGQSIVISPTINVSANVNNRLDLNKLAEDLSDILTTNMQNELRRRVSYS